MPENIQCSYCGALMNGEDLFCGECGAPRLSLPATPRAASPAAPTSAPPSEYDAGLPAYPAARGVPDGRRTAVKVIAVLAVSAAVGLCGMGMTLAFAARAPELGQAATQDMLVGATVLCFCPGVMALSLAAALWAFVIRRR